jgi:hypothetical protein
MRRKRIMTLFTFDSSQLNLQGAVSRFDLVQTITEISLFFLLKKYSGASTILQNMKLQLLLETKSCGFMYSISYNFVYKRQFLNLIWLNRQERYHYFCLKNIPAPPPFLEFICTLLEAKLCDFLYSISYNLMYERQF